MQLDFIAELEAPRARHRDPETSHVAAAQAKALQADHCSLILGALQRFGPMNVDRIAAAVKLNGYQVGKRMHELEKARAVEVVEGVTALSDAGRPQRVWRRRDGR
jgi:predicted ArsR family transcriptional regulator